ncbi:MAG: hypothetical protein EA398_18005 [Deltaproteobacteria bacterium]|nr:MAG: hypothetical protein EA398_18005 [Deltaproteobacteria bacterium]
MIRTLPAFLLALALLPYSIAHAQGASAPAAGGDSPAAAPDDTPAVDPDPPAAQQDSTDDGAYTRAALERDGFVAASEVREGDLVPGGPLLFAAYLVFFTLLLLYVLMLVRRQRAVATDLQGLQRRIEEVEDRLLVREESGG